MDWNDPTNVWGVIHGSILFAILLKLWFPGDPGDSK